jgi:hypothetical protein
MGNRCADARTDRGAEVAEPGIVGDRGMHAGDELPEFGAPVAELGGLGGKGLGPAPADSLGEGPGLEGQQACPSGDLSDCSPVRSDETGASVLDPSSPRVRRQGEPPQKNAIS